MFFIRIFAVSLFLFNSSFSLRFYLPNKINKCIKEEVHKDVLVTGEYEVGPAQNIKTNIKVSDTKGQVLYQKDDITKGKFVFTTEEFDIFQVCFESSVPDGSHAASEREVFLDLKHGVEAKSYESIAKAEKLKPLEVELKRLEDLSESIVNDFAYMKSREEEMRDTNQSTHSRVLYLSFFSMFCLLTLATWQVLYLRRYFKSKKLIE